MLFVCRSSCNCGSSGEDESERNATGRAELWASKITFRWSVSRPHSNHETQTSRSYPFPIFPIFPAFFFLFFYHSMSCVEQSGDGLHRQRLVTDSSSHAFRSFHVPHGTHAGLHQSPPAPHLASTIARLMDVPVAPRIANRKPFRNDTCSPVPSQSLQHHHHHPATATTVSPLPSLTPAPLLAQKQAASQLLKGHHRQHPYILSYSVYDTTQSMYIDCDRACVRA